MKQENFYLGIKNRGVAILFAILLVSIVLTVGLSLLNITVRQLLLSSLARESQFAFYAADSARACARHYDSLPDPEERPFGYFGLVEGSGEISYIAGDLAPEPGCGNLVLDFIPAAEGESPLAVSTMVIVFSDEQATPRLTCAEVEVTKYTDDVNEGGQIISKGKTRIVAKGYNNFDPDNGSGCYQVSDRTVERASTMLY